MVQLQWFIANLSPLSLFVIPTVFKLSHVVSLASTSFIEEEHQTSYFFGLTISVVVLFRMFRSHSGEKTSSRGFKGLVLQGIGLLGLLKVARCWNQTGDKWGHLVRITLIGNVAAS